MKFEDVVLLSVVVIFGLSWLVSYSLGQSHGKLVVYESNPSCIMENNPNGEEKS